MNYSIGCIKAFIRAEEMHLTYIGKINKYIMFLGA